MWLFTRHGFYSLTRSTDDPAKLQVRARVRRDLENLQALTSLAGPILETQPPTTAGAGSSRPPKPK